MTLPEPLGHRTFVHADGLLAEFMCQVHLIELTRERARQLRFVHRHHPPDECLVHLEAAFMLAVDDAL
ncbi:hypothetical protein [Nocardia vaccinii]|uniref:hypothetical protein n=1 Tax=Nocardia vaccinii TaxID=1822 RepID=UPI00082F260B|nr:hypothetical protein [Nocardia vaccinii]